MDTLNTEKILKALENSTTVPKCRDCPWESCESLKIPRITIPLDLARAVKAALQLYAAMADDER